MTVNRWTWLQCSCAVLEWMGGTVLNLWHHLLIQVPMILHHTLIWKKRINFVVAHIISTLTVTHFLRQFGGISDRADLQLFMISYVGGLRNDHIQQCNYVRRKCKCWWKRFFQPLHLKKSLLRLLTWAETPSHPLSGGIRFIISPATKLGWWGWVVESLSVEMVSGKC